MKSICSVKRRNWGKWLFAIALMISQTVSGQDKVFKGDSTTLIPDTLLFRLEKYQAAITEMNGANKKGYNGGKIHHELVNIKANVNQIDSTLQRLKTIPDSKSLLNYRMILSDAEAKVAAWRKSLTKYNADLQRMSEQVIRFSRDSLLVTDATDTTQRKLYASQISDLRNRLQLTGKVTVANLDTVSRLLADVSAVYFQTIDLQTVVDDYLRQSGKNVLRKEYSYLWNSPATVRSHNPVSIISASYVGQDKILRYFLNSTWESRILRLMACAAFFAWVYINFRLSAKPAISHCIGETSFTYIGRIPILPTLVILLSLAPAFEPDAPSIYIELNQFLLMVTLSLFLYRRIPPRQFRIWFQLFAIYGLVVLTNTFVQDTLFLRSVFLTLNVISTFFGLWLYREMNRSNFEKKFTKPVLIIYMALNMTAVLLNVFGRISLAKSFSLAAVIGLVQVLNLIVLVRVMTEAMDLHVKVSTCSGRLFSRINVPRTNMKFRRMLIFLSVALWTLTFTINLNIIDPLVNVADQLLTKPRSLGSITFSLGNVLYFALIVYLANMIQKNIGILFGSKDTTFGNTSGEKNSKLALVRLLVIIIGFLLAVSVSGMPLDKITVLIGALGVGIGLGLQNIINNFVSGIILIFEKPFRIGDFIELADKKGKILDIGIRSSKMLTAQGSRVVIPNGDLLSGRLVNYTEKNTQLKSEITFKIHADSDLSLVKKLIGETLEKGDDVIKKAPRQILFNAFGTDHIELKILVWIKSVYAEAAFKSYVLENLYLKFKENNIKIM